jgi:hypothetical protein
MMENERFFNGYSLDLIDKLNRRCASYFIRNLHHCPVAPREQQMARTVPIFEASTCDDQGHASTTTAMESQQSRRLLEELTLSDSKDQILLLHTRLL